MVFAWRGVVTALLSLTALLGCGSKPKGAGAEAVQAYFLASLPDRDPAPAAWLAFPFPSDHRRTAQGTVAMADFPNPYADALLERYIEAAEQELFGFATNASVHIGFNGPLDTATIPTEADAFAHKGAPLQLVDVTQSSPEYGMRRPLQWEYRAAPGAYVPAYTLAVAPAWGFPLREETSYALLVSKQLRGQNGMPLATPALLEALLRGDNEAATAAESDLTPALVARLSAVFAPLRGLLLAEGSTGEDLAVATVFTTQSVTADLGAIFDQIMTELPAPPRQDGAWQALDTEGACHLTHAFAWSSTESVAYHVMEGRYAAPNYQLGEIPYDNEGGGFQFINDAPQPTRYEELRFVLSIPEAPPPDPAACYALVVYSHGTTGNAWSLIQDGTAGRLAARDLAAIAIDQPLHGLRGNALVDEERHTFNVLNPSAIRTVLRQGVADTFSLIRFVKESLAVPATKSPTSQPICFASERLGFFGHSQGGVTGAMAAAFAPEPSAWLLSGAGGGMSITAMERKQPLDLAAALTFALGVHEGLTAQHPLMTLIQTMAEVTDPLNYANFWLVDDAFGPPQNVLVTSGLADTYTAPGASIAMAVAGSLTPVLPLAAALPSFEFAGIQPASAPVEANLRGHTAAFVQWQGAGADHFVVFNEPEAIHASMTFLASWAHNGTAPVPRQPNADVR